MRYTNLHFTFLLNFMEMVCKSQKTSKIIHRSTYAIWISFDYSVRAVTETVDGINTDWKVVLFNELIFSAELKYIFVDSEFFAVLCLVHIIVFKKKINFWSL